MRDKDTTTHYVGKCYPAVADPKLYSITINTLKELCSSEGIRVHEGIVITTSATLSESDNWACTWGSKRVLCVDCETSILYVLSSLSAIPSVNILVVSDHVLRGEPKEPKLFEDLINKSFDLALRASYESIHHHNIMREKG